MDKKRVTILIAGLVTAGIVICGFTYNELVATRNESVYMAEVLEIDAKLNQEFKTSEPVTNFKEDPSKENADILISEMESISDIVKEMQNVRKSVKVKSDLPIHDLTDGVIDAISDLKDVISTQIGVESVDFGDATSNYATALNKMRAYINGVEQNIIG